MGRNLGPLNIKDSYEGLVQISGSNQLTDGSGSLIPSLDVTASYAATATSASHSEISDFAFNATSASFATTALLATSASHAVSSDTAVSASYSLTASYAENVEPINTGSFYISSSITDATITFTQGDGSTEVVEVNNVSSSISASYALAADTAISSSYALTASYAENAGGGGGTLQETLLLGNSASIDIILTGSYLRYSGSFSGSVIDNITDTFTSTEKVQHIVTLTQAEYSGITPDADTFYVISDAPSSLITASAAGNVITFTKEDTSTFPITVEAGKFNDGAGLESLVGQMASSGSNTSPQGFLFGSGSSITTTGKSATILGSYNSTLGGLGLGSAIIGGSGITISSNYGGGVMTSQESTNNGYFNFMGGTIRSTISGNSHNFIIGGDTNSTNQNYSGVIGGSNNTANANSGVIVGGNANNNTLTYGVIVGGQSNTLSGGTHGAILGGWQHSNTAGNRNVTIGGSHLTINGGDSNTVVGGNYGGIYGGFGNTILGAWGTNIHDNSTSAQLSKVIINSPYSNFRGTASPTTKGNGKQIAIISSEYSEILGDSGNETLFSGILFSSGSLIPANSKNRVIIGGTSITASTDDTVYVPNLNISGSVTAGVYTLTDAAGTTTMDCSLGNFFTLAMPAGGSTTLTPTNITAGQTINVKITQNATPSTIAFAAAVDFEGGTPFAVSTGAGEVDVMTFISFDGTTLQATGLKNFS